MKQIYFYDEQAAVEEGLKALYRYNNALRFPVDESYINESVLSDYFLSEDEHFCIDCEKRLGRSVIKYCCDNPDILNKSRNAQLMYSQFLEAMRGAKIEAEYNCGKYGVGIKAEQEREQRLKENAIVQKPVFIEKAKKYLKDSPIKIVKSGVRHVITPAIMGSIATHGIWGATIAGASVTILGVTVSTPLLVGAAVGIGMSLAYEGVKRLMPPKIKKEIKKNATKSIQKAANVIERNIEKVSQTPIGQKVTTFMQEKIAPIVNRGAEVMEKAYSKVKSVAKSACTRIKSWF